MPVARPYRPCRRRLPPNGRAGALTGHRCRCGVRGGGAGGVPAAGRTPAHPV